MKLDDIRDDNGKLPAFAWPGGYPILYLDGFNSVLCPDCANGAPDVDDDRFGVKAYGIHWEGEPETCCNCNTEIDSAYGVPEGDIL